MTLTQEDGVGHGIFSIYIIVILNQRFAFFLAVSGVALRDFTFD